MLPYTNDDPVVCRKLEDAGAAAVMPLGAPIGSGLGIQNVNNLRIIREFARVPLIVDAGVGTASDAALAMELGADGVLMNTAIAGAQDPVAMAEAMKLAVRAGRLAYPVGTHPAQAVREREQPGRRPGRTLDVPKSPDDLEALKAERAAADRAYNDALTRLDRAIQQLPADFPQPPPVPDEHQVTPLNTLWKIDAAARPRGLRRGFVAGVRRAVAPLFEQQQAFNAAVVDHVNRNVPVGARDARVDRQHADGAARHDRRAGPVSEPARRCSCSRSRRTSTRAIATSPGCCAACRARSTPSPTRC